MSFCCRTACLVRCKWQPQGRYIRQRRATQIGGDAQASDDVLLGNAVVDAAAADEFVYVAINKFDPRIPTFAGAARITKAASANAAAAESGVCYDVTADAAVITLPATAVGLEFTVIIWQLMRQRLLKWISRLLIKTSAGWVLQLAVMVEISNTKATAKKGDFITFVADGVDGYRIKAIRGT
jgi:hypothetical protein